MFNSYKETRFLGFRGIVSNVSDELLTPGFVPDMENITINKEGLAESVFNPAEVDLFANVPDWTSTSVVSGELVRPVNKTSNKHFYVCTTAGTTGTTEPTWIPVTGSTTSDGSVVWTAAEETTDPIRKIYVWSAWESDEHMMVQIGGTVFDTFNAEGHIFHGLCSFASVSISRLFIMNHTDGLWEYSHPYWFDRSSPTADKPPKSKYITYWQNRLWAYGDLVLAAGASAYRRIMCSELPGDPITDPVTPNLGPENWNVDNYFDIVSEGSDTISGAYPFGQAFYVFTLDAIFALSGTIDTETTTISEGTNVTFNRVYTGKDMIEENFFVGVDSIYYFSKTGFKKYVTPYPETISDVIEPSISSDIGTPQGIVKFKDRIYFLINGTIWGYHLLRKTWEKYVYSGANCITAGEHLYIGTTDGKCYKLDVAGTGYTSWYIKTPNISFGDLYRDKHFLNIKTYYKTTDAAATLKETFYLNHSTSGTDLTNIDTYESGATDEMREDHQQTISDVAKTIQYKFYGTDQVKLLGYDIGYTVRWIKNV